MCVRLRAKAKKYLKLKKMKDWLHFPSSSESRQSVSDVLTSGQTWLRRFCSSCKSDPLTTPHSPPGPGSRVSHVLQPASGGSYFSFSWLRIMSLGFEFLLCYFKTVWLLTGEGTGYPHQYSSLENSINRGGWWATVHGVAKSQTQLSD